MTRFLLTLAIVAWFAWAVPRAVDHEHARAYTNVAQPVEAVVETRHNARSESVQPLYQGRSARWWARRAVQARRDANARGRTIRRLKRELARGYVPWYWLAIGSCESGLRWTYNGSSGFDGGVQFHPGTWSAYRLPGYPAFAYLASPFQQLVVAELVLARQGWGAWPACARKVGLR